MIKLIIYRNDKKQLVFKMSIVDDAKKVDRVMWSNKNSMNYTNNKNRLNNLKNALRNNTQSSSINKSKIIHQKNQRRTNSEVPDKVK